MFILYVLNLHLVGILQYCNANRSPVCWCRRYW